MTIDDDQDDYDTRFEVSDPGFSLEEDRIHGQATAFLTAALKQGKTWKQASRALRVTDPEFKAIILDDYLKITLAQRHFQEGEAIKTIASSLKVPPDLLLAVRAAMIKEVEKASVKAYHLAEREKAN